MDEKRMKELLKKEEELNRMKATAERARVRRDARIKLFLKKAQSAGIVVTDKEVDEYIKTNKK